MLKPQHDRLHLSQTQQWWVVLLTQHDDGQPLKREQGWATFVVYVLPPWQPPPYTDWRGESGDRCLTTPSRPRLRPLSHPPVCAGCHSNWPEHLQGWVTLQCILAHKQTEEFIEHVSPKKWLMQFFNVHYLKLLFEQV